MAGRTRSRVVDAAADFNEIFANSDSEWSGNGASDAESAGEQVGYSIYSCYYVFFTGILIEAAEIGTAPLNWAITAATSQLLLVEWVTTSCK